MKSEVKDKLVNLFERLHKEVGVVALEDLSQISFLKDVDFYVSKDKSEGLKKLLLQEGFVPQERSCGLVARKFINEILVYILCHTFPYLLWKFPIFRNSE